jgi:hypothetical protein
MIGKCLRGASRVPVQQGVTVRNPCHALTNRTPFPKGDGKGAQIHPDSRHMK